METKKGSSLADELRATDITPMREGDILALLLRAAAALEATQSAFHAIDRTASIRLGEVYLGPDFEQAVTESDDKDGMALVSIRLAARAALRAVEGA